MSFVVDFHEQFDQAGVLVRADETHWVKAGVEISDGEVHVGAVTTHDMSDWSLAPVPSSDRHHGDRASELAGRCARRARSRLPASPWQAGSRVPWLPSDPVRAGPYVAAPSRAGLQVRITG